MEEKKKRKKKEVSGWISAADCVDFYADDFGWKVDRWFQLNHRRHGYA
jgi:predicted enzyme related to lactoylglutathione lyase